MGILDTVKDVVTLMQKVDNIELIRRMLELQTQVVALNEENLALKERLTTQEQLSFRDNFYWRGDDGPFCSSCWDDKAKLVRIHKTPGYVPVCPNCKTRVPSGP